MGEDPQFDLRVVGGDKPACRGAGDEGGADLLPLLGADRDVLKIWIARGESAGGGDGLVEGRVDASRRWLDQQWQRIDVGALELGELAVLEEHPREGMARGELFEYLGIGARAGLRPLHDRQAELVEQHRANLDRRGDSEGMPGQGVDLRLEFRKALGIASGEPLEERRIDPHPVVFHRREDRGKGDLHVVEERAKPLRFQARGEEGNEVGRGPTGGHGVARIGGALEAGLANFLLDGVEIVARADRVEIGLGPEGVVALARIEEVTGQEGVKRPSGEAESGDTERQFLSLQIVGSLRCGGIGKEGREGFAAGAAAGEERCRHPNRARSRNDADPQRRRQPRRAGGQRHGERDGPHRPHVIHDPGEGRIVGRRLVRRGDARGGWLVVIAEEQPPLTIIGGLGPLGGCLFRRGRFRRRRRGCLSGGLDEALEAERLEEGRQGFGVGAMEFRGFPRDLDRDVRIEADKLAGGAGGVGVEAEVFLLLRPLHFGGAGEDRIEIAELLEQLGGRLRPDGRDAGDVVGRVADERQPIDDLVGTHAPVGEELLGPQRGVRAEIEELHPVGEELPGVLVGGGERHAPTARGDGGSERGEDVVGLEAGELQAGDPHRGAELPDEGNLRHEIARHLGPRPLVGRMLLVAEGGAGGVHGAEEIIGLPFLDDPEEVLREAVDGLHRRAGRARHLGERVEELVDARQRVDHPHRFPGEVGGSDRRRMPRDRETVGRVGSHGKDTRGGGNKSGSRSIPWRPTVAAWGRR